ncbi:MAG TPA: hypothetical protein PLM41_21235 [Saprospiraceae bacterium]|nr:hypothetical protein [Saprospiraceae bacterium]
MKRLLLWVLILQFSTGHNMLEEVLRLPMLLDHFRMHQSEAPDLSFGAFFIDHYLNVRHEHQCDEHAKLPLHCSHSALAESTLPCPLPAMTFSCGREIIVSNKMPLDNALLPSGDYESGLFRPPIA